MSTSEVYSHIGIVLGSYQAGQAYACHHSQFEAAIKYADLVEEISPTQDDENLLPGDRIVRAALMVGKAYARVQLNQLPEAKLDLLVAQILLLDGSVKRFTQRKSLFAQTYALQAEIALKKDLPAKAQALAFKGIQKAPQAAHIFADLCLISMIAVSKQGFPSNTLASHWKNAYTTSALSSVKLIAADQLLTEMGCPTFYDPTINSTLRLLNTPSTVTAQADEDSGAAAGPTQEEK